MRLSKLRNFATAWALVAAISALTVPFGRAGADVQPDIRAQSQALSLSTASANITVNLNFGVQMIQWQIVTGPTVNAADRLIFENSPDLGTTWNGAMVAQSSSGTGTTTTLLGSIAAGATFAPSANTTYTFWVPVAASTATRVRVSTNNPGDSNATVAYNASTVPWSPAVAVDTNGYLQVTAHAPATTQPVAVTTPIGAHGGVGIEGVASGTNVNVNCAAGCAGAITTPLPTISAGVAPAASYAPVLALMGCVYPAGGTPAPSVGNTIMSQCDLHGNLGVVMPAPNSTSTIMPASPQPIKASAGTLVTGYFTNNDTTTIWCGIYNATSITLGTTNPTEYVAVPAGLTQPVYVGPTIGKAYATGIMYACETTFRSGTNETAGKIFASFSFF